jgi:penicillin-binding protein 1A
MSEYHLNEDTMREQKQMKYAAIVRWMWRLFFAGIAGGIITFVALSFSDLPDTQELENPRSELASEILANNGEVLGRLFTENRVAVSYEELSPYIIQALIATEDVRYHEHSGIDFKALGRVFFKTILMGDRSSGGASTITQQLAKLLFTGKPGSGTDRVIQKLKEWIIAVQLERKYTKEEIIAMYLNKFDFLYDSYGIKAASETYFGKSQDSLNVEEAAMLVGMLKNPWHYNPRRRPERAQERRNVVLYQMVRNNILEKEVYDSLKVLPVDLSNFKRKSHTEGLAQYFRSEVAKMLVHNILPSDEARKKADGSPYNPYKDGLKIYTTIDPAFQKHAEQAMFKSMKALQERFWRRWFKEKKMSPWDYVDKRHTTQAELNYRKWKLRQMIRESDRYAQMREHYMNAVESKLEDAIPELRLSDVAIERMIEESEQPGYFAKLVSRKTLNSDQVAVYKKALEHELWEELKTKWQEFQAAVEDEFNKPVKMKVFDYNETFEKDTTMTPLDSLKYHHLFLQIGSLAVDPRNGHVKAWIGGINHKYFAYDHTRSNRQVGSTFKPFIYATAIAQQGISPCQEVDDIQRTIFPGDGNFGLLEPWTPNNADGKYSGQRMQLRQALKKSVNTVSVFLMQQLGSVDPVIELLGNMGIDTKKIPKQPSICLGAADLSVYDMTGAYTTFANNGYSNRPIFITRIEDKNGRTIYAQEQIEKQVLEEEPNYVMVEMLKYASGRMGLKSEVGGKTGTTNNYVDGWFMAITPTLVVGTWVGGEDRWVRFLTLYDGQGSRMAKPFCKEFLSSLENDPESGYNWEAKFVKPQGDLSIGLDCAGFDNRDNSEDEFEENPSATPASNEQFFEDPFGTGRSGGNQ